MTILEFTYRYFSFQQTALVDKMLKEDQLMNMYNNISNLKVYDTNLSSGKFTGTHQELRDKREMIQSELKIKKSQNLINDIELLETAIGINKNVFEWYLVPYWIASYLIISNEVILSWQDCYWWGRCSINAPLPDDSTISNLFANFFSASQ